MDKFLKIGKWLWRMKERFLLVIMVFFLILRVYRIIYPPPGPDVFDEEPPRSTIPEEYDGSPPKSPGPFDYPSSANYEELITKNPFWVYSSAAVSEFSDEVTPEDLNITLLRIQRRSDGTYNAQLRTKARRWYREGEHFESYIVESIDPEAGTCDVYSEQLGRVITLSLEE